MADKKKPEVGQPALWLIKSESFDLCSSYNRNAASPRGSFVRSCSMSLMEEAASPTDSPISARVIPAFFRRSDIRSAHVFMPPSLRESVATSQRRPVTVNRENGAMPRPKDMPDDLLTIGKRVRWWREHHRRISRKDFAKKCGMGVTTLSDLELDRTVKGSFLHVIAANLGLNPHYLETGKGEPESGQPQEFPAEPTPWPFPAIPRSKLEKLNRIERSYAETKLREALADIEAERKHTKDTG